MMEVMTGVKGEEQRGVVEGTRGPLGEFGGEAKLRRCEGFGTVRSNNNHGADGSFPDDDGKGEI